MGIIEVIVLIAVYFVMVLYVFPKFGISTWASRACNLPVGESKDQNTTPPCGSGSLPNDNTEMWNNLWRKEICLSLNTSVVLAVINLSCSAHWQAVNLWLVPIVAPTKQSNYFPLLPLPIVGIIPAHYPAAAPAAAWAVLLEEIE